MKFSDYYNSVLLTEIEEIFKVSRKSLFSGSRNRKIMYAKRMYITVLRNLFTLTYREIGELTNLSHASAIHHSKMSDFFREMYVDDEKAYKRITNRLSEVGGEARIIQLLQDNSQIKKELLEMYNIKTENNG